MRDRSNNPICEDSLLTAYKYRIDLLRFKAKKFSSEICFLLKLGKLGGDIGVLCFRKKKSLLKFEEIGNSRYCCSRSYFNVFSLSSRSTIV